MKHLFWMTSAITFLILSCGHEITKNDVGLEKIKDKKSIPILIDTYWECKIAENCRNVYFFNSDSTFLFYSCEREDSLYGAYYFRSDTLMIDEKGSVFDRDLPKASIHDAGRYLYWTVLGYDTLRHVKMSEWVNDKFEESNFSFDNDVFYLKQ